MKLGTHRLKPRRAFGRSERTGASGDNSGARSFEASSDLHEVRMKTYFGSERTWAPNPAPHGKAIVSSPQCVKSRDIVNRCLATLLSGFSRGLRVVGCLWVGRVVCRWARLRCGPGIALRPCGSFLDGLPATLTPSGDQLAAQTLEIPYGRATAPWDGPASTASTMIRFFDIPAALTMSCDRGRLGHETAHRHLRY